MLLVWCVHKHTHTHINLLKQSVHGLKTFYPHPYYFFICSTLLCSAHCRHTQINFLNQINDNRNEIDMLLIHNGSVQIHFIGLDACNNNQKMEKNEINCVDGTVDFALVFVCAWIVLTSHSSNRAFHYYFLPLVV